MKKTILFFSILLASCAGKQTQEIRTMERLSTASHNDYYVSNRAPLQPLQFIKLPAGSIEPEGWIRRQIELQKDGLCGHLGEISAWLQKENNAWLKNGGEWGWEEVPYWLRGYGNMAYALRDETLLKETKFWIEAILSSQRADGNFGPVHLNNGKQDFWPNMIVLWIMQSYHEYTNDNRVIDFMTRYCHYLQTVPDDAFLSSYWENSRGGDNLWSVVWLYNRMGDESLLRLAEKILYLYATEDIRNTPIHRSRNLVDWEEIGTAFTEETRPTFEPKGGLWAPDINYINGQYVLYYSMSVWGGEWTCGIGVATSDKPEGPFIDKGPLFRSKTIQVQNSIDQFFMEDNGKKYLFWGSFRGIYGIELSGDGLSVRDGAKKKQVAGTAYEGTYIHKRGDYYYLFASIGSCCEGLKSTYTTVVGRSDSLFGPYTDKQGRPMMENHHEVLIHGNDAFVGTGHNSEIVTDDRGNDWVLYHAVSREHPTGRVLMLDRIRWRDGWPEVEGASPSLEAEAPEFIN